jgi:nucleoside-diphosphate-sugar epimerase
MILVTGGAGFIGSHLVAELTRRKQKVRVLDNLSTGKIQNMEEIAGVSLPARTTPKKRFQVFQLGPYAEFFGGG